MNVDEFHPSMIVKHYCTNEKSNKGKGHSHEYCIQAIQLYIEWPHFKVKGFTILLHLEVMWISILYAYNSPLPYMHSIVYYDLLGFYY
jgi:hypothetical protein